jgi:hypothetical protein
MNLFLILRKLVALSVRARIVDAFLLVGIQLVESGIGTYVDGAVESSFGILLALGTYQFHVPGELGEGGVPLGGLSLHAFTLVLHEDHLLRISILDVANGPVGTLLGDLWKWTRFLLDAEFQLLLKAIRQKIEPEVIDIVLDGIYVFDLAVVVLLGSVVHVLVTVSGR